MSSDTGTLMKPLGPFSSCKGDHIDYTKDVKMF